MERRGGGQEISQHHQSSGVWRSSGGRASRCVGRLQGVQQVERETKGRKAVVGEDIMMSEQFVSANLEAVSKVVSVWEGDYLL
jgi:hypothetical protein